MTTHISRRKLLSGAIKAGVAATTLRFIGVSGQHVIAVAATNFRQNDRFKPALKQLDDYIARHMAEVGAPGLTLALADRNGLIRSSQYGLADTKTGAHVMPDTLFEIGSISKSFVALATVQLAEEGKLDLRKPVIEYLPWLKIESKYAPFTTHHLLSHTAGLSGVPLLLRVAAQPLATGTEPGKRFVYSNIGYVLVGLLIETVDKRPFADVIRKRVLDPMGIKATEPVITNGIRGRMAVGYRPFYDDRPFPRFGKLAEAPWIEVPEAAGSIASTASDMALYMQMLLNRGAGTKARVLSEKSFDLFIKPVINSPFRGEPGDYAYGFWVSKINDHTLLRHTGGMVAFSSAIYADVSDGFGAFASVNARLDGGYRPVAVTRYALDLLSATSHGQPPPAAPAALPRTDAIKNVADYVGTFSSSDVGNLVFAAEGDHLILQRANQKIVLEQAGRDRFIVKHPDFELYSLNFSRKDNVVTGVSHGARWWTNEHYSGPKSFDYPKEWEAFAGHYNSDSPWYGSVRLVIRRGTLLLGADQPLLQVGPGVFRLEGDDDSPDRITFDTVVGGRAMRMNFSGIEFYRVLTP